MKKPRKLGERASEERLGRGEKANGIRNKESERGRERENKARNGEEKKAAKEGRSGERGRVRERGNNKVGRSLEG